MTRRIIDLSHPITAGMITYPGLPGPEIEEFVGRSDSAQRLAPGVSFHMGRISMVANTGTYLDAPFHFHASGADVAGLDPARLTDVPVVVVEATGATGVGPDRVQAAAALAPLAGAAVLVHTGWSRHWGTPAYGEGAPYLTAEAVDVLVSASPSVVGIDSLNIDDVADTSRPAHVRLLGAGIPILEHLTNLAALPSTGARLTALPPPVGGLGTMPVRAVALVD